jgi:hypothetical protein
MVVLRDEPGDDHAVGEGIVHARGTGAELTLQLFDGASRDDPVAIHGYGSGRGARGSQCDDLASAVDHHGRGRRNHAPDVL